jgi:hypothetical protein
MTITDADRLHEALTALREGNTMLLIDIKVKQHDQKTFIAAIKRAAEAHNGGVISIDGKFIAVSDMTTRHKGVYEVR